MEGKKKKRSRSPDSSFFPSKRARLENHQDSIVDALNPAVIAKKKEKLEKDKALPPEKQEQINMKAFQFVVGDALPLSTVESPRFRDLIKEVDPRVRVFCVKTLKLKIAKEFFAFKEKVKQSFLSAHSVCLTSDVWGAKNRSFLGVTAHWIVEENGILKRKSAGIACKRFAGMSHVKNSFKHAHYSKSLF